MPQPGDRQPDWAALTADAVAHGPASVVTVISSRSVGATVEIVFDGDPGFRPGRFGVRFQAPEFVGDARWHEMAAPQTRKPEDWARIAAIVEVLEPYQAVSEADIAAPDPDGIRWLKPA